jgi:exosortase/archaeosortase family protein
MPGERSLAERFISFFTLNGRLAFLMPVAGAAVIAADIWVNRSAETFRLATFDYIALMLGAALIAYPYVPERFAKERNMVLIFSIVLFCVLVAPILLLARLTGQSLSEDLNSPVIRSMLSEPVARFVSLFGTEAHAYSVYPSDLANGPFIFPQGRQVDTAAEYVVFRDSGSTWQVVQIGLSCTGLYSVSIFVSLFIAYVTAEYPKMTRRIALLLGLGVLVAWLANLLRMSLIVLAGAYYGGEALLWMHANIGEIIFIAWVLLFWLLLFRVLDPRRDAGDGDPAQDDGDAKDNAGRVPSAGDEPGGGFDEDVDTAIIEDDDTLQDDGWVEEKPVPLIKASARKPTRASILAKKVKQAPSRQKNGIRRRDFG